MYDGGGGGANNVGKGTNAPESEMDALLLGRTRVRIMDIDK